MESLCSPSHTSRRWHGAPSRGAAESQEACCTTEEGLYIPCPTPCHVCAPAAAAWPSCGASRASSRGPPCPPIIVGAPSMGESKARTRDSVMPRCSPPSPPSRGARSTVGCAQSRQQRGKVVQRGSPDLGAGRSFSVPGARAAKSTARREEPHGAQSGRRLAGHEVQRMGTQLCAKATKPHSLSQRLARQSEGC